LRPQ